MSIDKDQEEVLQDEINLMEILAAAASSYKPKTALGQTICQGWYNTLVEAKESNIAAIGGSQEEFDSSLVEEEQQLQAFLQSVDQSLADANSWTAAYTEDLEIIEGLRELKSN